MQRPPEVIVVPSEPPFLGPVPTIGVTASPGRDRSGAETTGEDLVGSLAKILPWLSRLGSVGTGAAPGEGALIAAKTWVGGGSIPTTN